MWDWGKVLEVFVGGIGYSTVMVIPTYMVVRYFDKKRERRVDEVDYNHAYASYIVILAETLKYRYNLATHPNAGPAAIQEEIERAKLKAVCIKQKRDWYVVFDQAMREASDLYAKFAMKNPLATGQEAMIASYTANLVLQALAGVIPIPSPAIPQFNEGVKTDEDGVPVEDKK